MKQIIQFLSSLNVPKHQLILLLSLVLSFNFIALGIPEVLRLGTDAITYGNLDSLLNIGFLAAVVVVLYIILDAVIRIMDQDLSNKYEEASQTFLLEKIIAIKKTRLSSFKSGEIVTHMMNNAADGTNNALSAVISTVTGASIIIFGLVYMFMVQWQIALAITLYNIGLRSLLRYLEKYVKANQQKTIAVSKVNNSFLFDILANMMTVRVFNKIDSFASKLKTREANILKFKTIGFAWRNGIQDGTWMAIKLAEFFILYGFGGFLVFNGQATIGALLAFTMASDMFSKGLDSYTWAIVDKNRAIAHIESLKEVTDITELENEPNTAIRARDFDISFKNVSFSHGDNLILDDFNFDIAPKEKILIKGANGRGKSTMLNLMTGLLRPSSGSISYGDFDISITNLDQINKKYAYISQNSNILQGNVYQNIALSQDYNKALCDDILAKLNLEKIIDTAPQALSQGEKQRLNIARALYRLGLDEKNKLVFGDEIFSNIDKDNVKKITSAIAEQFKEHTVIMVCHEDIDYQFDRVLTL